MNYNFKCLMGEYEIILHFIKHQNRNIMIEYALL